MQFNSLHAQREACESYISSQRGEGWVALPEAYDDGGYSGASLERPALRQMMADVDAGHIDIVVVYKIDRLSRSLRDFVQLIDRLERRGATFVAVTQSFSTTTSMGRLTLNILLSFAQFERELTSERLKDKFGASRARGLWLTGGRPLGYRLDKGRLIVDEAEAELVRLMFKRYPKCGSTRRLAEELSAEGYLGHRGRPLSKEYVARHLQNRLYRGDLVHQGRPVPGTHEPIVTESAWLKVREAMAESARHRKARRRPPVNALLRGLLFASTGHAMVHKVVYKRTGRVIRYYHSSRAKAAIATVASTRRYRAAELEAAVIQLVERRTGRALRDLRPFEQSAEVRRVIARIDIGIDIFKVAFKAGAAVETELVALVDPRG